MSAIISVNDLSIQIKKRSLIHNISFVVNSGDVVLLSGENGSGKSSILKAIMKLESEGKTISGEIIHYKFGNILNLEDDNLQTYRSRIAYIPQKDEYSEMGQIQVRDIISNSSEAYSDRYMSCSEVNELIDKWLPHQGNRVFEAKSKPCKFSGGEQRLLQVFSVVATRSDADLLIIDEPLNNLDFINVKRISNLINRVTHENPKIGIIMISHCRIFPFITRELKLTTNGISEVSEPYTCHSCFGEPNNDGYYII